MKTKVKRIVLTDLGSNGTQEEESVAAANATLDRWCLTLAPHCIREFRADVWLEGEITWDNPGLSIDFPLRRENHGQVDLDAYIKAGKYIDPATFVVCQLLNYHQELNDYLFREVLRGAPHPAVRKAVGRWIAAQFPESADVVLIENLEGD